MVLRDTNSHRLATIGCAKTLNQFWIVNKHFLWKSTVCVLIYKYFSDAFFFVIIFVSVSSNSPSRSSLSCLSYSVSHFIFFSTSYFSLMLPCVSSFSLFLFLVWNFPVLFSCIIIIGIIFITLTSSPIFPYPSSSLFSCCITRQSSGLVLLNRLFCYIYCFTTAGNSLLNTLCVCVCVCVCIYIYICIHTHTYLLSPWSRVLLENLPGFHVYTHTRARMNIIYTHVCVCMHGDTWTVKANIGGTHQLTTWHVTFKQGRWMACVILTSLGIHGKDQSVWYLYVAV